VNVYDHWSRVPGAFRLLYGFVFAGREGRFRARALDRLALAPGERVLEVGCGPGNSLAALREGVGPEGAVVALDASAGMCDRARERAAEWSNVHVVRGDARRLPVREFDAAYASMSLSAVPDPDAAVAAVRDALRPGGRLVLLDARPFPRWPWTALNPLLVPVSKRLTDWVPEADLPGSLRRHFDRADVATYTAGSVLVGRGDRAD
jgi:demethylmenaquinone methyltransferase/2-methoxy-6-polyprenyl-1,4-benzoquinol methylase